MSLKELKKKSFILNFAKIISSDDEQIPEDDLQRLSLTYLTRYAAGDQKWCDDYPEHGMPCRKCGQKGCSVINCGNPPMEKCVLCGAYDHHHHYCPDTCELEYKNFVIPCFHCRQAVSSRAFNFISG